MVYRAIGTQGIRAYTQAQADKLLITYVGEIAIGTLIRIVDLGDPPGTICVFNGTEWEIESDSELGVGGGKVGPPGPPGPPGVAARTFTLSVATPTTQWLAQHNLNSENVIMQCFDENRFVLFPESMQIVNQNQILIKFNTPQTGVVRVIFLD